MWCSISTEKLNEEKCGVITYMILHVITISENHHLPKLKLNGLITTIVYLPKLKVNGLITTIVNLSKLKVNGLITTIVYLPKPKLNGLIIQTVHVKFVKS